MATLANTQDREFARHAETYHRFMLGVKWVAIHLAAVMVFLILWFATPAGFGWGVIAGLAVVGIGVYVMNHGLAHSTEDDNPH
jgi:hypothetical protein